MSKKWLFLGFVVLLAFGVSLLSMLGSQDADMTWSMVDVNNGSKQGDAHLIQVNGGKTVLIDAGFAGPAVNRLLPYLDDKSVRHIHVVFISHPHRDHYEGIRPLLESGISIGEVYCNLPDRGVCDSEKPWGCDYDDVLRLREEISRSGIPIKEVKQDYQLDLGPDTDIKVLYAFDGIDTPVGRTGVNDLSLIMMLRHKTKKYYSPAT